MTVIEVTSLPEIQPVVFDLYRDIHKGLRGELFALTASAGQTDPSDAESRADLARHVDSVVSLLVSHAHHEDAAIEPVLERYLPDLAERIETDHVALDRRIAAVADMAKTAIDAPAGARRFELHRVYLELSAFVSAYLAHIDLEERYVGPALEQVVGVEGVVAIHGSIIASLTPEEMATKFSEHKGRFGTGSFIWFPEGEVMSHGATAEADVTVLLVSNKAFSIKYES